MTALDRAVGGERKAVIGAGEARDHRRAVRVERYGQLCRCGKCEALHPDRRMTERAGRNALRAGARNDGDRLICPYCSVG